MGFIAALYIYFFNYYEIYVLLVILKHFSQIGKNFKNFASDVGEKWVFLQVFYNNFVNL
jgi:hypothetical protein